MAKKTYYARDPQHHIDTGEIKITFDNGVYTTGDPKEQKLLDANDYIDSKPFPVTVANISKAQALKALEQNSRLSIENKEAKADLETARKANILLNERIAELEKGGAK